MSSFNQEEGADFPQAFGQIPGFGFQALAVEAIRELKAEVDSLKQDLEAANGRIAELESELGE